MWQRPGLNLSAGAVLDTESLNPFYGITDKQAEALLERGMAEDVTPAPSEPHETMLPALGPDDLLSETPAGTRRSTWKKKEG
jgi:hypothetical protein